MKTSVALWLGGQVIVFAIWAFLMFRMLWMISRRAAAERKEQPSGEIGSRFTAFFGFFKDPETHRFRMRLLAVTILLFAVQFAGTFLSGPG
ncbi:MAG TPA: hypothetical protein ENK41_02725 [Rhodobacteraceae bacterium]|nr:hypothetical protein [Paracoccaceae bacterium]